MFYGQRHHLTRQTPARPAAAGRWNAWSHRPGRFIHAADVGSDFRIYFANCQYVYDLESGSIGAGTYLVQIHIANVAVGAGAFSLKK